MFIQRLVQAAARDEAGLRRRIEELMTRFLKKIGSDAGQGRSARIEKAFAITYAAGILAREWGVLPKAWGRLLPAIIEVYRSLDGTQGMPCPSALGRIRGYVLQHKAELVRMRDVPTPLSPKEFEKTAGFLRRSEGCDEILIPATRFRCAFPDHATLMNDLVAIDAAKTEGGKQPMLTIKAPKRLCASGRVYCIRLSKPEASGG
jgi:hypothetical protein